MTARGPVGDGRAPNVRWSPHVDAPLWPWSVGGWMLAVLFVLLFFVLSR
jgi:hypothetical protein